MLDKATAIRDKGVMVLPFDDELMETKGRVVVLGLLHPLGEQSIDAHAVVIGDSWWTFRSR